MEVPLKQRKFVRESVNQLTERNLVWSERTNAGRKLLNAIDKNEAVRTELLRHLPKIHEMLREEVYGDLRRISVGAITADLLHRINHPSSIQPISEFISSESKNEIIREKLARNLLLSGLEEGQDEAHRLLTKGGKRAKEALAETIHGLNLEDLRKIHDEQRLKRTLMGILSPQITGESRETNEKVRIAAAKTLYLWNEERVRTRLREAAGDLNNSNAVRDAAAESVDKPPIA